MSTAKPISWAEHPDLVAFYAEHRKRPEDLYQSERRFLPWLAQQAKSILDVGCAAGGFSNIWRHFNPQIVYTGVDVSASLIAAAQKIHSDLKFLQGDCASGIPLSDRYAEVVSALGWLHWEPRYEEAIRELWRLTDRFLFLDIRLVSAPDDVATGKQQIAFQGTWDGETTTPYITVAWPLFAKLLLALAPKKLLGLGYWGNPADTVMNIEGKVCFATFVLEKPARDEESSEASVCVDLPLDWPADLLDSVHLLSASQLESLAPEPGKTKKSPEER